LSNFEIYVRRMYYKNCAEREANFEKPYPTEQEYYNKYQKYLRKNYESLQTPRESHSYKINKQGVLEDVIIKDNA